MASNAATARSSPRNTIPTSVRVPQREPGFVYEGLAEQLHYNHAYEGLAEPLHYNYVFGERVIPIPQDLSPL